MLMSFCIKNQFIDTKFNNMIKSIVDFSENKLIGHKGAFKKEEVYCSSRNYLRFYIDNPASVTKYSFLNCLADMINALPSPKLRKEVWNYFDAQTTLYCYSERRYTNQIPNYPYKSKNIVDLLEEVEQVRQARLSAGLSREYYRE